MKGTKRISSKLIILFLIFAAILTQNSIISWNDNGSHDLKVPNDNLNTADFWNNLTFIHITGLNWTLAEGEDWCSGSGTWKEP
ncbi:MAG: hypothetical protein EU547_07940, partial [Promethearchaeota archaeon]